MDTIKLAQLILKYLNDELTVKESASLHDWLDQSETNRKFFKEATNLRALKRDVKAYEKRGHRDWKAAWEKLNVLEQQAPAIDEPQGRRWHLCFIEV